MTQAKRVAYGVLLGAAMAFCASAQAVVSQGGTIVFTGALVAPSYLVSIRPTSHSNASTMQSVFARNKASVTEVSFTALPGGLPSADVTLTMRAHEGFIDGKGQRINADRNGAYHIGATGGVLSILANSARQVTINVSYQ
jgi:hypothetical protein